MRPRIGITSRPLRHGDRPWDAADQGYVASVRDAGGLPLVLPTAPPDDAGAVLDALDGMVLTGGGDVDPARYGAERAPEVRGVSAERDAWELALLTAALARDVPVLGVCRGCQVLAVHAGGTLVQHLPAAGADGHLDVPRELEAVHRVHVEPDSALAGVLGVTELGVNSIHHQAVATVGDGLRVVARAPDGTIEGVEAPGRPVLAVQWHPELLQHRAPDRALFRWVVERAGAGHPSPRPGRGAVPSTGS